MGPAWRTLLPLAVVLVLADFITGALASAGTDDPPRRAPVDMVTTSISPGQGATTPVSPTTNPSPRTPPPSGGVAVVSPRPGVGGDDGGDDDRGNDRDDDRDDDDERDDD